MKGLGLTKGQRIRIIIPRSFDKHPRNTELDLSPACLDSLILYFVVHPQPKVTHDRL